MSIHIEYVYHDYFSDDISYWLHFNYQDNKYKYKLDIINWLKTYMLKIIMVIILFVVNSLFSEY